MHLCMILVCVCVLCACMRGFGVFGWLCASAFCECVCVDRDVSIFECFQKELVALSTFTLNRRRPAEDGGEIHRGYRQRGQLVM